MILTHADTLKVRAQGRFHVGIPSLHRYDLLDRCIEAILKSVLPPASILVLDNGGKYNSRPDFKGKIEIIRPGYNLGVPQSWNFIHDYFQGEDVYLLNDDIFVQPHTFDTCQSMPGWFVTGYQFGCHCVRELCWNTVGKFDDEIWPMYWEDCDYIARMVAALDNPYSTDPSIPFKQEPGGIISCENIPEAKPINFESGAKSEQTWMYPFKDRIARRHTKKWGTTSCHDRARHKQAWEGKLPSVSILHEYYGTFQDQALINAIYDECMGYRSVVILGGGVGESALGCLLGCVGELHLYNLNRRPEWDFIPNLCRTRAVSFSVHTDFLPEVCIPPCEALIIHDDQPEPYRRAFANQAWRADTKYICVGKSLIPPRGALSPVKTTESYSVWERD